MEILNKLLKDYFKESSIEFKITNVQMDSNKVTKGSLFFAINKGNEYIKDALEKGAELIIGDNISEDILEKNIVRVKNTVSALQELATLYRERLNVTVIGITGSEGKTTTKDLAYSVISQKYRSIKTLGNYNNHIGLPFTIFRLTSEDEVAVLEMGMSNIGEIDRLCQIAKPDYAIITNIGDSHLEFLKNRDNVFRAKTEILKYVEKENVLVIGDDPYLRYLEVVQIGFKENNLIVIRNFEEDENGCKFKLLNEKYSIPINGWYNVLNASLAIVLGRILKVSYNKIQKGLNDLDLTGMRFEKIVKNNILYINDAYNASPVSMKAALSTFKTYPSNSIKVVVLGDMLEMGENEINYHEDVLKYAKEQNFDKIFIYGNRMKEASLRLNEKKIKYFEVKSEIIKEIKKLKDPIVLLKGSRGMRLEEIIN